MRNDNITAVLGKFINHLQVPLDVEVLYNELLIHPDYPSLLAISDVLTFFKIENNAYNVSYEDIVNLPCPFIAHTKLNDSDFVVVTAMTDTNVFVSNDKWIRHKIKLKDFKESFSNVVLTAEGFEPATGIAKIKHLLKEKDFILSLGLLSILLLSALLFNSSFFFNLNWLSASLCLLKLFGITTSVILLCQSIDNNNPLVQKLCHAGGDNVDCNAILSSKAAKVFEGLTWSEVGFFYFTGTFLALIFGGGLNEVWKPLFLLNVMSLPYTFYSIYYQARIAKQWCIFCCTVQALLWLEFVPLLIRAHAAGFELHLAGSPVAVWSGLLIAMLLPVVLWRLLKPFLLQEQQLHSLKQQLQKFKYNADLFNRILLETPKYVQPDQQWSIVLGKTDAQNVITMVTNSYCPPCARMHKSLTELLDQNGGVQARIVFTARNTDNDRLTPVSRHLMALNELPDKRIVTQALHDWYGQKQKDYAAWAKVYPIEIDATNFYKLEKQKDWCEIADVSSTPTVLLNGYQLPPLYQLTDLKYMLT